MRGVDLPLGIDIATSRLRVVQAHAHPNGHLEIIGMSLKDLDPGISSSGLVPDGPAVAEVLSDALAELGIRRRRFRVVPAATTIASDVSVMRALTMAGLFGNKRREAAELRAASFNEWPIDDCDVRVRPAPGDKSLFIVCKAKKDALRSRAEILRNVGLAPIVEPAAIAVQRALAPADAVLDVGASGSTFMLFRETAPLVKTFKFGGDNTTSTVARALGVEREVADLKKRDSSVTGPAQAAVDSFVDDFISHAKKLVGDHHLQLRSLHVIGRGARLVGFYEVLKNATNVPVGGVDLSQLSAPAFPPDVLERRSDELMLAIGSALFGAPDAFMTARAGKAEGEAA